MEAAAVQQEIAWLQQQVRDLLAGELFVSAEILGGLVLARSCAHSPDGSGNASASASSKQPGPAALGSHADSLELYGDALMGLGESRRALAHYEKADTHRKVGSGAGGAGEAATNAGGGPAPWTMSPEAALGYKQYKCHLKLNNLPEALRALTAIPARQRLSIPTIQAALGALYRKMVLLQEAAEAYRACVEHHPLLLEAVVALAELGVGKDELWALLTGSSGADAVLGGLPAHIQGPLLAWLEAFVAAHCAMHDAKPRYDEAAKRFAELERRFFPRSGHCLLRQARMQIEQDQLVEAQATFVRALEADGQLVDFQDYHAVLLRQKAAGPELTALAKRLMDQTGGQRPEAWIAVSLHADLRGDKERAMAFVDKALGVDPAHVLAYHVKGTLLLAQGRAEAAATAFVSASLLRKDIYSYKGLVDAYLAQHKYKEALSAAKEALADLPKNAKAITLVGRVLAHLPEGRDKAKRAFQKALAIDPLTIDAALALADLHMAEGGLEACAVLLRASLDHAGHDFLWAKLGECYTLAGDHSAAMEAFHAAISANPASTTAAAGLDRLEKLMRGMDPDELEGDVGEEEGEEEGAVGMEDA